LLDNEELDAETDPNNTDSDSDELSDYDEVNTYSTNPNNTDSDGDGLSDGDEVNTHNTDPNNTDSDGDELSDEEEINTHNTNPNNIDSDTDGFTDDVEIDEGTNPSDATSFPIEEEEKGCSSVGQSPSSWSLPFLMLLGMLKRRRT
jgi:uncharacterized protein (TIGR03382 family)